MVKPKVETPWSSVGLLTYKRTYARQKGDGSLEDWTDTVDRVVTSAQAMGCGFSSEEAERLRGYHLGLKGSVAGRFLWQLGTPTVEALGLASLQNCCGCVVDKLSAFTWTFDYLMLGAGVGYNIQREYVYQLPKVQKDFKAPTRKDESSADFIVPDTREGWVKLLDYTLRAAFTPEDKRTFSYSTQLVRGYGTPIKGFGGTASGPEPLCLGIAQISKVISQRRGKKLRPIDCLDIMNIIGSIVVAGNVRRSAQIAIGDPDDLQFLRAKRWETGTIPNWRSMSNNSVVCNDISTLPQEFWKTYDGKSEPYGLINLRLSRSCGRAGDTRYKDRNVAVYNPCAEQGLDDGETCCLAEVFLPNVESKEELLDICKLLYRVNKHSLSLDCHHAGTAKVVHKNYRMGIGVTGILQARDRISWLSWVYEKLREFDKTYSKANGFPESIKLTTCKPSGTLSLLPGVTPGIHPGFAQYMIRRIRMSSDSALVETCRNHGYPVEYVNRNDGTDDRSTVVVEFPFSYPEGTVLARDLTAIEQLEWVKTLQEEWSDNSVSCTVYYKPEELDKIREYLAENYDKSFKSLSFLLHSDHGFVQAPFEEITKEEYDKRVKNSRLITDVGGSQLEVDESAECAGGMCPLR